nr:MAG TPA: hypothetical protein [Caudoviricetes sp.]
MVRLYSYLNKVHLLCVAPDYIFIYSLRFRLAYIIIILYLAFLLNSAQIIQKFMAFLLERQAFYDLNKFDIPVDPI